MANDSEAAHASGAHLSMPASERAERLLACVRKACNHDLSNQMVALQGMLHLLMEEEQERLSAEGREYVQRALAAARRAVDMVQTLKDLTRWAASGEKTEQLNLAEVLREAQMEINQLFSDRDIAYDLELAAPVVSAGRRSLFRVFVELGRLALSVAREGESRLLFHSVADATGVTVRAALAASAAAPRLGSGGFAGLQARFEFLVARELLATCDATLALEDNGATPAFVLRFPNALTPDFPRRLNS